MTLKKIELYQRVALTRDIPEYKLCTGDVAVVVEHLPATTASGGEEGYALEVFNAIGDTIAVVMVPASSVKPLTENESLQVRSLGSTRRPYRKLRVQLSEDDRKQVTALLRNSREPARVLKRVEILRLLDKGEQASTVSRLLDASPTTVRNIGQRYNDMGLDGAIYDHYRSRGPK